jgi:tripartite-type tricarboxylate transporter receptor subunit TctC
MGHLIRSRDSRGSRARRVAMWLISAALLLAPAGTLAQDAATKWPERAVRFVVPFPAGSATDIVARIIAQKLTTQLGQQFVIDNRSGASGDIGTTAVVRADPDGYTMGLATASTHAVSASRMRLSLRATPTWRMPRTSRPARTAAPATTA